LEGSEVLRRLEIAIFVDAVGYQVAGLTLVLVGSRIGEWWSVRCNGACRVETVRRKRVLELR
jgi:hypothetical protein